MDVDRATTRSATATPTASDAAEWAERLLDGTSLLVAGPRGSGRSHAMTAIASEVSRRGGEPLEVRTASSLSALAFAAVDASAHPALRALRNDAVDAASIDGVLVVDDVELLDAASMRAVARAIASRRLTAVFALRTPRPRSLAPDENEDEVRRSVRDLVVEHLLQRVDLAALSETEAMALVAEFSGAHLLDSATRAGLVWRADGSRELLRHLVLRAVDDARNGRDPLARVHGIAPLSPLAVALERHVAEFGPADLQSLAGVRRLPHLETAVATRLFDADSIHALLADGLLHADSSAQRRLTANDLIASEAERRIGVPAVDAFIDAAGRRMLAEADEWWSAPVAITLARRWHRLGPAASDEDAYPPALRARVALDAARDANDRNDAAHAAVHAQHGRKAADTAPLRLEAQLAAATDPASSRRDFRDGVDAELRRRIARSLAECEDAGAAGPSTPERALADARVEELLSLAARRGAHLDWAAAAETAGEAVAQSAATAGTRLRAIVMAGTAEVVAGRWRRAKVYYRAADRMLDARNPREGLEARDRLSALMFMLAGHQIAGADGAALQVRLERETATIAREGEEAGLTLAGAAAAIAYAGAGRAAESQRELESAMARTPSAVTDPDATMIELGVAEELAMAGKLDDARAILVRLDDLGLPLLRRSRLYVQTTVLEAEGSRASARDAARAAADLTRGTSATALRIRDLFRLTALGNASDEEVDELVQLAATTDLPLAADAVRRASARSAGEASSPVDELRLHALWSVDGVAPRQQADARDAKPRLKDRGEGWGLLTAREHEIAMMANAGLTNREIALRLFLSVRTVESHVYQARAKVGAPSRRELGRMVASGVLSNDTEDATANDDELSRLE